MSNHEPKPKRSKFIHTWFKRTNVESSSSNVVSEPSISSPNIDVEPQPSIPEPQNNINALERDPGLRCAIWKYPVNERDSIRKTYVLLGPFQPELEFPFTEQGSQQRRFQFSWFKSYPWLEYSIALDRAYCFPCFLFDTEVSHHPAFTIDGFKAWKRVSGSDNVLMKHVGGLNSPHHAAMQKWDLIRNPTKQIETVFQSKCLKDIEDNRLRLKASIESVRLLANQGAAFRGHDETEDSLNAGHFREVIKSFSRMSVEVERVVLGNAPGNAKYISPSIQKQLLNILGNKVRNKIREEVGDSKYCILVDEAVDTSSKEQMAIILRFVDCQGIIRERFFKIVSVPDTTSQTLKDEISKVLTMYNLQVRNMRGQGYDGASNMRAKGVHDIWQFFSTLSLIVNFVDSSAKRHSALKAVRKEEIADLVACGQLQTGTGANQVCTLQRAAATRWSSHFRSIKSLIELFSSTKKTLDDMIEQAPLELQGQALSILKAMRSFDFVFCLLLMHKLMKITEVLCQTLQRKSLDFVHAMKFVGHTKSFLQEMREEGWDDLVRNVESFCEKHDIDMPDMNARYKDGTGRGCQQRGFITVEHHYRIDVFNALVDFQLSELNRRFSDQTSELLILSSTLDPRDNFRNFKTEDACNLAKKFYPEDFVDSEMFALELECAYYEKDMRSDPKFQNLESISDLCRMLVQTRKSEIFPMLYRLICLVLTIPVSTATTERAFSAMNIIKNKLRNKMEDEFLGDCMVLHIEKEYAESIDNESVIKDFEACGTRRVRFS
ncbi:zinc finger MYM-type protein 1 [Rosa sericea]